MNKLTNTSELNEGGWMHLHLDWLEEAPGLTDVMQWTWYKNHLKKVQLHSSVACVSTQWPLMWQRRNEASCMWRYLKQFTHPNSPFMTLSQLRVNSLMDFDKNWRTTDYLMRNIILFFWNVETTYWHSMVRATGWRASSFSIPDNASQGQFHFNIFQTIALQLNCKVKAYQLQRLAANLEQHCLFFFPSKFCYWVADSDCL